MLKELAVFLLGATAVGIAVLMFSVDLPAFSVSVAPTAESLKHTLSLFTAASVLLLILYAEV